MPKLTESRQQARREQITQATIRCATRQGFAATSMADIIAESGLSAGSIYSHFSSKAELVRFAITGNLEFQYQSLQEELSGVDIVLTPGMLLRHLLASTSRWMGQSQGQAPGLLQIWAEVPRDEELIAIAQELLEKFRSRNQSLLLPWAQARTPDQKAAEIMANCMADTLLAVMQGYLVRLSLAPSVDREALQASLVAVFD